jgi:hypothetical protein
MEFGSDFSIAFSMYKPVGLAEAPESPRIIPPVLQKYSHTDGTNLQETRPTVPDTALN